MGGEVLFQMWESFRQSLIAAHLFYVKQARQRLLSQFEDIEGEADKAAEVWLVNHSHRFDPDVHVPGEFEERAFDAGIEFYQLLTEMRDRTLLSVVSGMYHEWDKHFRQWLVNEIKHWHRGDVVAFKVWTVDLGKLTELLASVGWDPRGKDYFDKLDACRLVVNVYKHGNGNSLSELKEKYPDYLSDPASNLKGPFGGLEFLDHNHLYVSDQQLQEFADAIVEFWKDVPSTIFDSADITAPVWFDKARAKDVEAAQESKGGRG
ncbi:hypothetical protein [Marinobacter sp. S0848L]|uniref:hypothetical protein n=1 Tax=Marinobacter sp. S0848L TaxID=2926423 RepID=UPI001FF2D3F4|nr:hypothetical protein [Marinobacter sp. S0848L]MCK0106844.1 hypothetical protein [Marinobacter sp. S0848L]